MKATVLIECGAAETRAACIVGDEAVRFWFNPARGDEAAPRLPARGDEFLGRIKSVSKPLNGAFLDIGGARDCFLALKKGEAIPVQGSLVHVIVRRPQIGDKGAVVALADSSSKPEGDEPGPIGEPVDAAIHAVNFAVPGNGSWTTDIVCNDGLVAGLLRDHGHASVSIQPNPFDSLGAQEALETALERQVTLPGGARLTFDETEGPTIIDVDAGGAADGATGRLNDKVNLAAARALPAELSRRAIGGRVVIDFLPPSGAAARHALVDAFKKAGRDMLNIRVGRLSADGLLDATLPREGYSLLEQATEPASGGDFIRPGRRFTLDWQAKAAIRALEKRLAAAPSARLKLFAGREICGYLDGRAQWTARLATKYGARFDVACADKLQEQSFDIAE